MSVNIYDKDTDTLNLVSGRVADAYSKAQIDEKLSASEYWLKTKNLFNQARAFLGKWNVSDGTIYADSSSDWYLVDYFDVDSSKNYTISANGNFTVLVLGKSADGSVLSDYVFSSRTATSNQYSFVPTNCAKIVVAYGKSYGNLKFQFEEGGTATSYVPYSPSNVEINEELSIRNYSFTDETGSMTLYGQSSISRSGNFVVGELVIYNPSEISANTIFLSIPSEISPKKIVSFVVNSNDGSKSKTVSLYPATSGSNKAYIKTASSYPLPSAVWVTQFLWFV